MSRINTNVQSVLAQRILGEQNSTLSRSLERLSTGLAINRGSDDPAGLIASESLRSEKASITTAMGNAERTDQVMNIAEGGLQEISALLLEVQSLVTESGNESGLSTAEKDANQLQVDSILQTIDRIAASASFQGIKLLNGTYDFTITNQASTVADLDINAAKLSHNETRAVSLVVTTSAQHGSLFLSAGSATNVLDFGDNAAEQFVLEIAGADGSREFSYASGTSLADVATGINTFTEITGVSAVASGRYLELKNDEFGSTQFVRVKIVDDAGGNLLGSIRNATAANEDALGAVNTTFANATNPVRDDGQDVGAIINGIIATTKGAVASINTDFLDVNVVLTSAPGGAQTLGTINAFTITGSGGQFNIGPQIDITNQASIGIPNVASRFLGDVTLGYMDDLGTGKPMNIADGNHEAAQKIVDAAISQVSSLRGRIGAFQRNVLGSTIRSLGIALENTSAAESAIRDTDFAGETASLTRAQILVNAATSVLSIANAQPQSVLTLLQ